MLDQILQELEKEGFCYLTNYLDSAELGRINGFFDQHKSEFFPARVGSQGQRQRAESIRGDYTFWLDPLNPVDPFKNIFVLLQDLREKLNARFFLGLQEFECHLAFYPPGTFYKKHLDRFEKNSSRRLSFIFYLNESWKKEDGGELVMYDQSGKVLKEISPLPGSFVCFLSDEYPHEVKSAIRERRSLTGWMHTKIIN